MNSNIKICSVVNKSFERFILFHMDASLAYTYSLNALKQRWFEAEPFIMKDSRWAFFYSRDVIKGRWNEAEPIIVKDKECVYYYARDIAKGRLEFDLYFPDDNRSILQLYIGGYFE